MKRYYIYLKKYRRQIIFLAIFTLLGIFIDVVFPYINGKFIDSLVSDKDYKVVVTIACIIWGAGALNLLIKYLITCYTRKISEWCCFDIKNSLIHHFRKISILRYQAYSSTYLSKRIEQDSSRIISFFLDNYIVFFAKIFQLLMIVVVLMNINITITVGIAIISPIYYVVYKHFKSPIFQESLKVREDNARFFQTYNEQLEYMEDIVIESNYPVQNEILQNKFGVYFDSIMKYTKTIAKFSLAQGIYVLVFQMLVFILGGFFVLQDKMTVGELTTIITYFSIIMSIISYYTEFAKSYQVMKASVQGLDELFDIEEYKEGTMKLPEIKNWKATISFAYNDNHNIFSQFAMDIHRGETVGIVGMNGSGKTTLSKLMIGAIKNDSGKQSIVFNDTHTITDVDTVTMRKELISYIPQKIRYVNRYVYEIFKEVWKDGELEGIVQWLKEKIMLSDSIINFLHESWNKRMEELSGGDRQLIAILKNLVMDKDVIILDEPSSNLDIERIEWLKGVIREIKEKKIILIITHDENLFELFDRTIQL